MKIISTLLMLLVTGSAFAAGGFTIQNLPNEPEESNPVCRDASGKLANCTPTAGVGSNYLAPIAVDECGTNFGTYLGTATFVTQNDSGQIHVDSGWELLTEEGYTYLSNYWGGIKYTKPLNTGYFREENCEGMMLVKMGQPWATVGYVNAVPKIGGNGIYYWDKSSHGYIFNDFSPHYYLSTLDTNTGVCANNDPVMLYGTYAPFKPNDPEVTGVGNKYNCANVSPTSPAPPLQLQR